jgi:hypothetical protein
MTKQARLSLSDAERAIGDLRAASSEQWRPRWVGTVALLRAVGNVLHDVDRKASPKLRGAIDSALPAMEADPLYQWLVDERNTTLKTYRVRVNRDATICITRGFELQFLLSGETRPAPPPPELHASHAEYLAGGHFQDQDPGDVAEQVVQWWRKELDAIDGAAGCSP